MNTHDDDKAWEMFGQAILKQAVKDYISACSLIKHEDQAIKKKAQRRKKECLRFFRSSYGALFLNGVDVETFIFHLDKRNTEKTKYTLTKDERGKQ